MQSSSATVIENGQEVELVVTWTDRAGQPATPDSVRYGVFDVSHAQVGASAPVADPAPEMTFVVPGSALPGDQTPRRKHSIVVEGTFAAEVRPVVHKVEVKRGFFS